MVRNAPTRGPPPNTIKDYLTQLLLGLRMLKVFCGNHGVNVVLGIEGLKTLH